MKTALQKNQRRLNDEFSLADMEAAKLRSRSFSVGTAFGGNTEISMRMNDGKVTWAVLSPPEVVEIIHQLSANIGCHLHLTPRDDFSSWRNWRVTEDERKRLNGHPAFPNDMEPHMKVGTDKFSLEDQRRADSSFPPEMVKNKLEKELDNVVAAQETIDRRSIEQSSTSS
jgi:hypothetical protein